MAELSGRTNEIYVLAGTTPMTNATGAAVNGISSTAWSDLCEILDVPQFGDTYVIRKAGLKDTEVTLEGYYDPADTNGQAVFVAGNSVMVGIYPQGTTIAGRQVECIVESVEISAEAEDMQSFSVTLKGTGAPVALPLRP